MTKKLERAILKAPAPIPEVYHRVRMAVHILRGRPAMFRMRIQGPLTLLGMSHVRIEYCEFSAPPVDRPNTNKVQGILNFDYGNRPTPPTYRYNPPPFESPLEDS